MSKPSQQLNGLTVGTGWTVSGPLSKDPNSTGGNFSTSYKAEKGGVVAFMKAMDLHEALLQQDILLALNKVTSAILFEASLLEDCRGDGLSRVVQLIEFGSVQTAPHATDPVAQSLSTVYFFIFELADGDLRKKYSALQSSSAKLQTLHGVAAAISQLHTARIAHQDLKPSNVVFFGEQAHKIADLGCASVQGRISPRDHLPFPGDQTYMPPEFAYGYLSSDFNDRRAGSDVYALGSMISFLFCQQSASFMLWQSLPQQYYPGLWKGSFSDVLPYLVDAHSRVCAYVQSQLPGELSPEILGAFQQLTHPDPAKRGHPDARRRVGSPHGLERYVSLFDLLRRKLQVRERLAQAQVTK
jgi:eukaryotic-like serine/threonine-protein kinase